MKTIHHRILEVDDEGIIYYLAQHRDWWWPWWDTIERADVLSDARAAVKLDKEFYSTDKAEKEAKVIYEDLNLNNKNGTITKPSSKRGNQGRS